MPQNNGDEYERVGPCKRCGKTFGYFMLPVCNACLDLTENRITVDEHKDGLENAKDSKYGDQVLTD